MFGIFVITVVTFVVGVFVGTHVWIWVQLILAVLAVLSLNTWFVRKYEIGAIMFVFWVIAFIAGMIVGDISWYVQTPSEGIDLPNVIDWFKV